ncbi:hypothetical protein K3728_08275 [Rhodobacteraceae bacterium M385]|nr:hypothetical protein K3728_08275 [Rhodobacteraceae bacterium M385]
MIRLAALLALCALPASAQDFRGLRPGMPASALGPIGEPLEFSSSQDGTHATYPLPHGHRLSVSYSASGTINFLASFASSDAGSAPQSDGLRVQSMTLRDVLERLGEPDTILATQGLLSIEAFSDSRFSLVFDIGPEASTALILDFVAHPDSDREAPVTARLDELGDAVFTAASLVLAEELASLRHPSSFVDGPRAAPIPFPIPLSEAFPSLIP